MTFLGFIGAFLESITAGSIIPVFIGVVAVLLGFRTIYVFIKGCFLDV